MKSRKPNRKSKSNTQKYHLRKRFQERYGLNIGKDTIDRFIRMIQKNECNFVEKQSDRISIWDIPYEDNTFRVVYDKCTKNIVTVFPSEKLIIN